MGSTSPDALPWPEYADPGAVPTDMHELAAAVQTALNKKATVTALNSTNATVATKAAQSALNATDAEVATKADEALVLGTLASNGNFTASGAQLARMGHLVVARGKFLRSVALTVADNTEYQFATIPAGFRPVADIPMAGAWLCLNTDLTPDASAYMTTTFVAKAGGELTFIANVNGTLRTGGDYVSAGGLVWWTA